MNGKILRALSSMHSSTNDKLMVEAEEVNSWVCEGGNRGMCTRRKFAANSDALQV